MIKSKLYWICQLGGWFLFVLLETINHANLFGFSQKLMINVSINYILGIGLTHLYRVVLVKMGWLELPMFRLIPRAICSFIAITVVMAGINIPLDKYTFSNLPQLPVDFTIIYGYAFFWGKYILLWFLTYHLFQYWERSLKAERDRFQLQAMLKENQYNNLKSQLNPHFLFNSLNSIHTLVELNPETAKSAIVQLSGLLRSSLQMGRSKTVPLRDELQTLRDYIAIESIRFDDRLRIKYDIMDNTLGCEVPPMMLQTLVENAVKHGISNSKQGGEIEVRAYKNGVGVVIQIINSGYYAPKPGHQGFGLENTRERLGLLFDDKASFKIENTQYDRVKTEIILPA